jgi:transposase-like protein
MKIKRRNHTASFRDKVDLSALKKDKTLSEMAAYYDLHSNQI